MGVSGLKEQWEVLACHISDSSWPQWHRGFGIAESPGRQGESGG